MGRVAAFLAMVLAAVSVSMIAVRVGFNHSQVAALQRANRQQAASLARDRVVLDELCSTNSVLRGLVAQSIALLQADLASGSVPARLLPQSQKTLATYEGYQAVLGQHTACQKVSPP